MKTVADISREITRTGGLGDAMTLVVSMLLPLLQGWFRKCQDEDSTLKTPREAVLVHYDEATGLFDKDFIEAGRKRSRLAQKKAHRQDRSLPRIVPDEDLDRMTEAAYRRVLTEDEAVVRGCCEELDAAADVES